jgi:dihydropteroate synthase
VIRELAAAGVPMSIDTTRATVAAAALEAGVALVNDVSGGLADPDMARVVADAGCPWILMHWRGHSRRMADLAVYADVVKEVCAELSERVDAALAAGVAADRLILDPGLGFAKTAEHNWQLSAHLDAVIALGFPVLFGSSRKSYLGKLLAGPDGAPRSPGGRGAASVATALLAVAAGVWGVRVHDVRDTVDAIKVWQATRAGERSEAAVSPGPRRHTGEAGVWRRGKATPEAASRSEPNNRDTISLTGLRAHGRHGVYDFERSRGQDFVVDVTLELDLGAAAGSDDVADTVHYGELAERLVDIVEGEPVNLIETLADRLAAACLVDARVVAATVTVHKPQAPIPHEFGDVAVTLRRSRP